MKPGQVDAPWWLDTVQLSAVSLIKSLMNLRRSEPAAHTHLGSSSSRLPSEPEKTDVSLSEKSTDMSENASEGVTHHKMVGMTHLVAFQSWKTWKSWETSGALHSHRSLKRSQGEQYFLLFAND